jgi:hypothetical protein
VLSGELRSAHVLPTTSGNPSEITSRQLGNWQYDCAYSG